MRGDSRTLATLVLLLVLLVGCAAPDPAPSPPPAPLTPPPTAEADESAITVYGCPTRTLLPQDSRDLCAARIVTQLFSGLVELDAETGAPKLLVASSITADDATLFTIEVARGWTFHNGEPVTAQSFIDAWNFGADPDHGWRNAEFFSDIEGYEAVQSGEAVALSGLERHDEFTFTVHLDRPFTPFLAKLSDPAFFPLPSIAYEDVALFSRAPIGNGRFRLVDYDPDRHAVLERATDWPGPYPARSPAVTFLLYSGEAALETAYDDVLAGALDVLDDVPPDDLATVDEEFSDRVVRTPTSSLTSLGIPLDTSFGGDAVALRRALSMAIDRQAIADDVFAGAVRPADALIPPVLDAYRDGACQACSFDPVQARRELDAVGGLSGPVVVHYNSGAGHDAWIRAIAAQWRETLGIDEVVYQARDFPAYINQLESGDVHGPFRFAWALSYPSAEYALAEPLRSDGAANYTGYANPDFDAALDRAVRTPPDDLSAAFHAAEDVALADLPLVPLWFGTSTSVHAPDVDGVVVDARSILRVERLARVAP